MAAGCPRRAYPQARRGNAVRDKPFGIRLIAADAAACARHDKPDALARHLAAVVEQEGLHGSRHPAPPIAGPPQ